MPKIELPIKSSYVPDWGLWEAIREIIQNAKDEEDRPYGGEMRIHFSSRSGTLRVENLGTTFRQEVLLLGETTKAGDNRYRGEYGEGLNLALLALVRAGYDVRIETKEEIWKPALELSETFNREILTVDTRKRRKLSDRVSIQISEIDKEVWEDYRSRFLFLNPPSTKDVVGTSYGTLLRGERFKGCVYAHGIFVQKNPKLQAGYDFTGIRLDRDRRMIDSHDLLYEVSQVHLAAAAHDEKWARDLYKMLLDGKEENLVSNYTTWSYRKNAQVSAFFAKSFRADFGENAIPVTTIEEAQKAEHLGIRGVLVSETLKEALMQNVSLQKVREELSTGILEVHNTITKEETESFTWALDQIENVLGKVGYHFRIVTFVPGSRLDGLYSVNRNEEVTISIARTVLEDRFRTLKLLIHEIAHSLGEDGEKGHVAMIEETWQEVARNLVC